MSKITPISNGEAASSARAKINTALKSVSFTDLESGVVLDDDSMATATDDTLATSESIKAYVDNLFLARKVVKSYNYDESPSGTHYLAGYYKAPSTDANLSNASTTQTLGTANIAYGAHAFIVAGAAGTTDGSDLVLTVTGSTVDEDGNYTGSDSEVIVADCTASATDQYYETSKKWLGQITFTLSSTGGATFSYDFNYGYAKYEDFGNLDFYVDTFEAVGDCNSSDSSFDIELLEHSDSGWAYSAAAFVPGDSVICQMSADYGGKDNLSAGEYFAYKRTGLNEAIDGGASEGVIIRITQGTNNAVEHASFHIGVTLADVP